MAGKFIRVACLLGLVGLLLAACAGTSVVKGGPGALERLDGAVYCLGEVSTRTRNLTPDMAQTLGRELGLALEEQGVLAGDGEQCLRVDGAVIAYHKDEPVKNVVEGALNNQRGIVTVLTVLDASGEEVLVEVGTPRPMAVVHTSAFLKHHAKELAKVLAGTAM